MGAAAIPLSGIAPPLQNPMDTYARVMGIRAAQQEMQTRALQQQALTQENQLRQIQLQDQQGMRQAYIDAQGDPDKFLANIKNSKYGVSYQGIMQGTQGMMAMRKAYMGLNDEQIAQQEKIGSLIQGAHDRIVQAPEDQRETVLQRERANLAAIPGALQSMPEHYTNADDLKLWGTGLQTHQQLFEETQKQRTTAAAELTAQARADQAKTSAERLAAELPGGQLSPAAKAQATLPYDLEKARASGEARASAFAKYREYPAYDNQTKQTVYMSASDLDAAKTAEPGRYTAPQYTPEQIAGQTMAKNTGQITKPLTAFNTAITHLNLLSELSKDLNNSNIQIANRAKQRWAQETGQAAPVNFAAAVNAMSGEVAAALKASGATDQEISHVGATFSRAQSPAQLQGAISTYRQLLTSKSAQLQKQYEAGKQGKPAFGNQEQSGGGGGKNYWDQYPVHQ